MTENIKLHQGDCLEVMEDIPDKSVDMILCDLPYGQTFSKWDSILNFNKLWQQYDRVIKDNGAIVLFANEPFGTMLRYGNLNNYRYDWIWDKQRGSNFSAVKIRPFNSFENITHCGSLCNDHSCRICFYGYFCRWGVKNK